MRLISILFYWIAVRIFEIIAQIIKTHLRGLNIARIHYSNPGIVKNVRFRINTNTFHDRKLFPRNSYSKCPLKKGYLIRTQIIIFTKIYSASHRPSTHACVSLALFIAHQRHFLGSEHQLGVLIVAADQVCRHKSKPVINV